MRRQLRGTFRVPLPPSEAFVLFTARGEQEWVHGWEPHFPAPTPDDTRVGTVFTTDAHGEQTVWVVVDSSPPNRISYARITPGDRAGTVTVDIDANGIESDVSVTYDLTALIASADEQLETFASGYDAYLDSWRAAILAHLSKNHA